MATGGTIQAGARHLRAEWGRWWRSEDLTDTHIAHLILNDQYRMWRQSHQRVNAEVSQNINLLKQQQKMATYMQMQRMAQQKRGGHGGYGMYGGGGASPAVTYRMMQWAQLQMRMGQEEFKHTEITDSMLVIGRGQVQAQRHRRAAIVLPALVGTWAVLLWLSALAGLAVLAAVGVAFLAAAAVKGRNPRPRRPPVPKLLFVPSAAPAHTELAEADEPQPFPIREAGRDPRRAQESVSLALRKERAQVAEVAVPTETAWGWDVPLTLAGGTLGDLIRKLPPAATTLRVGTNRLLAQPADPEDSALVRVRVLTSDPFANPLPTPERAPKSGTITDRISLGLSIDGETTPIVLAGQHVLIVARSGGGKSSMVRTLADWVTSCRDAVAVDIDPMGRGLGPLAPCAVRSAYTPEAAEKELQWALDLARTRIANLPPHQDNHVPTPDDPAVIVFCDEWPRLTKEGRETGIALGDVGRKAAVTLVLCTTDATSDKLGDAIGDTFGVRILMPCRQADVPLVVGQADAVSQGWLPHLLAPSPNEHEPADAGKFYCITPTHKTPMLRYVSPLSADTAAARAKERVAAGLPAIGAPRPAAAPDDAPAVVKIMLAAFATEGETEALPVAVLADYLVAADPAVWGRWEGREDRVTMIGRTITSHLKKAGIVIPKQRLDSQPGRPMAYRLADIRSALS
ncbi:ATP-binding protein [Streptomyces rochei]|uniref:ATP-binding protein n=1 Tax=Streptomyces rochei TaxID=1928 RepID=UPI0022E9C46F|nr:ATP-binding protein [Streptomyces rochei]MCC8455604.1 ATP-binding protein [Streptomyces rochei]